MSDDIKRNIRALTSQIIDLVEDDEANLTAEEREKLGNAAKVLVEYRNRL